MGSVHQSIGQPDHFAVDLGAGLELAVTVADDLRDVFDLAPFDLTGRRFEIRDRDRLLDGFRKALERAWPKVPVLIRLAELDVVVAHQLPRIADDILVVTEPVMSGLEVIDAHVSLLRRHLIQVRLLLDGQVLSRHDAPEYFLDAPSCRLVTLFKGLSDVLFGPLLRFLFRLLITLDAQGLRPRFPPSQTSGCSAPRTRRGGR